MEKRLSKSRAVWVLLSLLALLMLLTGCGQSSGTTAPAATAAPTVAPTADASQYEFVFTGSSDGFKDGRTLNLTIYGNMDNTITLKVAELRQIQLGGTWVKVDHKGYKIYFDDPLETYIYTRFDEATNTLAFDYTFDCGNQGKAGMEFTYVSEAFGADYDGVGMDRKPPEFKARLYASGQRGVSEGTLTCREDGTFKTGSRTGTWDYDAALNQYNFHFEPDLGYNTLFHLDECNGHTVVGYGGIGDGILEWQFGYPGWTIYFNLGELIPLNDPALSNYTYDEETGVYTFMVPDENGNDVVVDYTIQDINGTLMPVFMPECHTTYDAETNTYSMYWETASGKFGLAYGTYTPEK